MEGSVASEQWPCRDRAQGDSAPTVLPPLPFFHFLPWLPIDQTQPEATGQEGALRRNATLGHGPGLSVLMTISDFREHRHQTLSL